MSTGYGHRVRGHFARSLETVNEALERAFNHHALVWALVRTPSGDRARIPMLSMTNVYELSQQGADVRYVVREHGSDAEVPL